MAFDESSVVSTTRVDRVFGSAQYFRLWIAQIFSSGGDWLALFAILITADRVGGGTPEASVAYVMIARFLPGLIFGSAAGVLVDRWDRKRTMIVCDLGRAATLLWLPFVDFIWQLVVASLILEGVCPAVGAGQRSLSAQSGAPREADRGQLPLAPRRLRHIPAGGGRLHRSGQSRYRARAV